MTIPWIKCSDRMPPDVKVIVQFPEGNHWCVFGRRLLTEVNTFGKGQYKWVFYDEETWKELNEK